METKMATFEEGLARPVDCCFVKSQLMCGAKRTQEKQSPGLVRLASLPLRPTNSGACASRSVSLLTQQRPKESLTTIYFFEDEYHMTFDLDELGSGTRVREFIESCMESYCLENYQFVPDHLNYKTFQLKLADLSNGHDPLIDPIDPEEEIECYKDCNLCLVRKDSVNSNLSIYQQTLPDSDVFEVDVHINSPRINMNCCMKMPPGSTFADLKARAISTCRLQQIAVSCIFVEYRTFRVCPDHEIASTASSRKFELIRAKENYYYDQPGFSGEFQETNITPERIIASVKMLNQSQLDNLLSGDSLTVQVQSSMLRGNTSITVQHTNFVERVEQNHVSKIVGLVWDQDLEKTYPLAALMSISAENNCVSLVFNIKGKPLRKDYKMMTSTSCKKFVAEVLRRCRLLKRRLLNSSA